MRACALEDNRKSLSWPIKPRVVWSCCPPASSEELFLGYLHSSPSDVSVPVFPLHSLRASPHWKQSLMLTCPSALWLLLVTIDFSFRTDPHTGQSFLVQFYSVYLDLCLYISPIRPLCLYLLLLPKCLAGRDHICFVHHYILCALKEISTE